MRVHRKCPFPRFNLKKCTPDLFSADLATQPLSRSAEHFMRFGASPLDVVLVDYVGMSAAVHVPEICGPENRRNPFSSPSGRTRVEMDSPARQPSGQTGKLDQNSGMTGFRSGLWRVCFLCMALVALGANRCVRFECSASDYFCRPELLLLLGASATPDVQSGANFTCALLSSGTVRCWGDASLGQLGHANMTTIGDTEPASAGGDLVLGGFVVQISVGSSHACALLATGAIRCWGDGSAGQLGYGNPNTIGDDETPASAGDVNVGGPSVQVVAGGVHSCALLANGEVVCWGNSTNGQLGYGNMAIIGDNETPASAGAVTVSGQIAGLTAGTVHTCALKRDGNVACWGSAANGRLGYGNLNDIGDNETPASAGNVTVGGVVTQIDGGDNHTCAVMAGGAVRCWGNGTFGRLGYANVNAIGDNETPASAGDVTVGGTVSKVSAGTSHTCATLVNGNVRCWGSAGNGRLGYGNGTQIGDDETPATAGDVTVGGLVSGTSAGDTHTCAQLTSGAVRCWGFGNNGRLGYGNVTQIGDDETPASAGDVPFR